MSESYKNSVKRARPKALPARQEGIIVVFTLLAVVLLLLASIALVRSFDTSLLLSGNMAFKRDLANQSERGNASAIVAMSAGGALVDPATREADSKPNNYSATTLPSDAHGIPTILVDDVAWAASGMALADLTDAASGTTVRYVIDRLCTSAGSSIVPTNYCAISSLGGAKSGEVEDKMPPPPASLPVYRVSIRVTGPRNTQTFVQSVLSL
ncbi:type IV pilus assembly protein PilX [Actimicrobium sp. GrIS 1.19]|uniref:hypothetical protein n=1 Tax=Actimicrobium sp. GrIS 1.19 TaxID=3071708 RepID=UPI002E0C3C18|nr:type IV pilus assembly protein PilX [Actimicrobium sp. GrIS 1.19]